MHSLVIFFVLPLLYFLRQYRSDQKIAFKSRLAVLTGLPILYVVGRTLFWSSTKVFSSTPYYHSFSLPDIFVLIELWVAVAIAVCLTLLIVRRWSSGSQVLISLGFFVSLLGISAYVLYRDLGARQVILIRFFMFAFGRSAYEPRHLTLMPLGISLILVGIFSVLRIRRDRPRNYLFGVLLSICVFLNLGSGFEYVVDFSKQQVVVEELVSSGRVVGVDKYLFADQSGLLNAKGRIYREKDWWGLVWTAYGLDAAERAGVLTSCKGGENGRFVLINGPQTHWQALKNWVSDGDIGFKVTVDDTPGACKPELMQTERVSGAIPILFYFTGVRG